MPELPEVERARQRIEDGALGRRIESVDDTDDYVCRPHRPGEIAEVLVGRSLAHAHRRGKAMWCETSDDGPVLGIHLGMAGSIVVDEDEAPNHWDRFRVVFADGGSLALRDKRRLGRVRLDPPYERDLGPDAAEIGRDDFRTRVRRSRAPVKARLLDQSVLAGVGNLLADETLWRAGIDPQRPADSLGDDEVDHLRRSLRAATRWAVAHGGVHTGHVIAERNADGRCPRDGTPMRRATVGGRTTWFCPEHQR